MRIICRLHILLIAIINLINLQGQTAPDKYRIQFTDKNYSEFSTDNPQEFLSQKALERRLKHNIPVVENDLPVSAFYADSLARLGLVILNRSKWFNAVTVYTTDIELMDTIHKLGFVAGMQKVGKSGYMLPGSSGKLPVEFSPVLHPKNITSDYYQYGSSANQVLMMKGNFLHNLGYRGEGIDIAIIDAGFQNAENLNTLTHLFLEERILGSRDFVSPGSSVYLQHQHGTNVLSVIAGNQPGFLIGTAPEASYWLLRSEDDASEYIIEEDNWVSAAEFADSAGVYIINTSLGYTVFDDPLMNHTYQDMDGKTTRISIASGIAASKGMLLFVSAGNEGNGSWRYISAPADNDSVIAVGAVNSAGNYAFFSSRGPAADGRTKPDVTAQGQGVVLQSATGAIMTGNGTSFSSPLVAGLAASLWQAFPDAKAWEIKKAIIESSSQYKSPDYFKGYGIPDFEKAYQLLDSSYIEPPGRFRFAKVFPNPFSDELFLEVLINLPGKIEYSITGMEGRTISKGVFHNLERGQVVQINVPKNVKQGVFILGLHSDGAVFQTIVVKN